MPDKISSMARKAAVFLAFIFILVFIDRHTKLMALSGLKGREPYVLIEGVLEFLYVENTGAAFGILNGGHYLFIALAVIMSILVFVFYLLMPSGSKFLPLKAIMCMIAAGAVGNCIDRLLYGYVVDFIYFKLIDFPVFNFADILVTCSAIMLILLFVFVYGDDDIKELPFFGKKDAA